MGEGAEAGSVQGGRGCRWVPPKQVQKKACRLEMGFGYRLCLHSSPHLQGKLPQASR